MTSWRNFRTMTAITSWRGTSSRIPTIFISERHRASVAGRFLDRFEQIVDQEIRDRAQEMGMTIDEVVTLASVIQAECSYPSEMANVSGVFHNRLDDPANYPKLQSDVTIFYIRTRSALCRQRYRGLLRSALQHLHPQRIAGGADLQSG